MNFARPLGMSNTIFSGGRAGGPGCSPNHPFIHTQESLLLSSNHSKHKEPPSLTMCKPTLRERGAPAADCTPKTSGFQEDQPPSLWICSAFGSSLLFLKGCDCSREGGIFFFKSYFQACALLWVAIFIISLKGGVQQIFEDLSVCLFFFFSLFG